MPALLTIVELSSFARDSEGELSEEKKDDLKVFLATNPQAGVVMPGTGGVRKLRWAASGRGKRGGGRVIYYFHDEQLPVFLIAFFTKNVRADLSEVEKKAAKRLAEDLVRSYSER